MLRVMRQRVAADTNNQSPATTNPGQQSEMRQPRAHGIAENVPTGSEMSVHPQQIMAKVARHLVPFLIFCYFLSYLDRVNIGFAALTMNKDIGLSASAFGFGASIFFLGYFLFEVPSNLLLEKFGARMWIARIMISWGILSTALAFVWNDISFYVLRFVFGLAEATQELLGAILDAAEAPAIARGELKSQP